MDLAALVRSPRAPLPDPATLRGLGDAWRSAESAVDADAAAAPRRAHALVERFTLLAEHSGNDEAVGRAARLRGSVLSREGRWPAAAESYERAAGQLQGLARYAALLALAGIRAKQGRTKEAVRLCRRVRTWARKHGEERFAAAALLNEATTLHENDDPARALPLYEDARRVFRAASDHLNHARTTRNLANALVLLDRLDDAAPLYDEAARGFVAAGSRADAAACRYNYGALLVEMDRLGEAEIALDDAERAFRELGMAADAGVVRVERGEALSRAHLLPEARRAFASGLRAAGARMSADERTRATLRLARLELALGNGRAARRLVAKRLPVDARRVQAERREITGRALALDGRLRDARAALEEAARLYGTAGPAGRARSLAAAAFCAAEDGKAARARKLAASAEALAAKLPSPGLAWSAAAAAFLAESAAGRAAAATQALERAFAALERVRGGLGRDAMRAALLRGSERWLARAVRHVLDTQGAAAALAIVERWRARALLDLLAAGRVRSGDEAAGLRTLREKLARLERRLEGEASPPFVRSSPAHTTKRLLREIASSEHALRRAAERQPSARFAPPADVDALVARLPKGTTVVALHGDDSGGVAFVVTRGGVRAVQGLSRASEVARLVEELHFRLGKFAFGTSYAARHKSRLVEETDSLLAAIAEGTLGPLTQSLAGTRRLVIVPHGPWHGVPFAALPFRGRRLVDAFPFTLAPALGALSLDLPAATGAPIVVASADAHAPLIDEEARAVVAALPGARLAAGDDAVASALDAAEPPSCLHVAAHGRFRADAPELGGVRLADGWFRAFEWRSLRLDGSLVVLSGCDTGVARVGAGDEVEGLVRGVLASGAAEAVVSLWRVGDAETARFMAAFHATRAGGLRPEEALRIVQSACAQKGYHPWAWAGFVPWSRRLN